MPLYEYQCRKCEHRFEELVSGSRGPEGCPVCRASELEKLPSAFAVGGTAPAPRATGACGSCGDPRGPGACRFDN